MTGIAMDNEPNEFAGMTTNERLWTMGLLPEFDEAMAAKNVDRVRQILERVDVDEASIQSIIRRALAG